MWMTCCESARTVHIVVRAGCVPARCGTLASMSKRGALRWAVGVSTLVLTLGQHPVTGATEGTAAPVGAAVVIHLAGNGFVLPVAPPPLVVTAFRPPADRFGAGHRGVDLAAQPGSEIRSAGSGRVVFAGVLAGRGVVSIEHAGGLRTTYEPVTASVAAGATVLAGQHIGELEPGHPGCAPAGCLHWGARLPDRTYLDPMSLLAPWRVRLLPWDGR